MKEILIFIIGIVFGVVGYFCKRRIEKRPIHEKLDMYSKLLEIIKSMKEQRTTFTEMDCLLEAMLTKSEQTAQEDEMTIVIESLLEMLAIHAGNEALFLAAFSGEDGIEDIKPKLDIASVTFHASYRMLRKLGATSESMRYLSDYEERIEIPSKYRNRIESIS